MTHDSAAVLFDAVSSIVQHGDALEFYDQEFRSPCIDYGCLGIVCAYAARRICGPSWRGYEPDFSSGMGVRRRAWTLTTAALHRSILLRASVRPVVLAR